MTFRPDLRPNYRAWLATGAITPPREKPRNSFAGAWTILTALGLLMIATAAEMGAFR